MELLILAGKYLLVALIYLFVFFLYRGLVAQTRQEGRDYAADRVPSRGPAGLSAPLPAPPAAVAERERPIVPQPPEPLRAPLAPSTAAASVRTALAEDLETPTHAPVAEALPVPAAPAPYLQSPAPGGPRLSIVASSAPEVEVGQQYPLLAAVTIGRGEHNLIRLADRFASSQHAIIFLKEGRRVLRDRGSTNGTLINGQPVTGDVALSDGDEITVGTTRLRYCEPRVARA